MEEEMIPAEVLHKMFEAINEARMKELEKRIAEADAQLAKLKPKPIKDGQVPPTGC